MSFTQDDLNHVLKLAHLDVAEEKKSKYLPQIQSVFEKMKALDQIDLSGVEPSSYASNEPTKLREDIVETFPDLMLEKNAPDWRDDSFFVPKILSE